MLEYKALELRVNAEGEMFRKRIFVFSGSNHDSAYIVNNI